MKEKIFYHYCDAIAFESIISKKCIWLSSINYSNDSMEIAYSKEILAKFFWENDMKNYQEAFGGPLSETSSPLHISSFSEKSDDLGQWWGYAKNGEGYAIGFRKKTFPHKKYDILKEIPKRTSDALFFSKVIYSPKTQLSTMQKLFPKNSNHIDIIDFYSNVNATAPIFKNYSFHNEKEWRLIYDPLIEVKNEKTPYSFYYYPENKKTDDEKYIKEHSLKKQTVSGVRYRTTKYGLTSYFEYPFYPEIMPIAEIIIGPRNNTAESKVREFLTMHGYARGNRFENVRRSEIPYR